MSISLFTTPIVTPSQINELTNISFVSTILTLLIVLSLVFTFHNESTTVHKVLGLLLVSIFVVFLWMFQTQFLFIYIVYIMAFISAVLMLFLSVVLMLPISTLTSKNYATDSRQVNYIFTPILFIFPGLFESNLTPSLLAVALLLSLTIGTLVVVYTLTNKLSSSIVPALVELWDSLLDIESIQKVLSCVQVRLQRDHNTIQGNFPYLSERKNTLQTILNYCAVLVFILYSTLKFVFNLLVTLFINFIAKSSIVSSNIAKYAKHILEAAIQTYLYAGLGVSMLALLMVKQTWFTSAIRPLNFEGSLGLSQIKELLYGDYSYFLLFSTVVLLVALFGAAIMTRNKR